MSEPQPPSPRWTVVIPFYNEAAFLPATLESLARQTVGHFALVLVDNASTDGGAAAAREWAAAHARIATTILTEPTPGQVHALKAGIAAVATELVAIADADTRYPPDYLATAQAGLDAHPERVGMIAHDGPSPARHRWLYTYVVPRLLPAQAHGGGYAHVYRTAVLKAAGGYDAALWPWVVKDHELAHRMFKRGRIGAATGFWCAPSDRRTDRRGVRWTLFERVLYHATPFAAKDWFFYRFLAGRFARRGVKDTVLRDQRAWEQAP